MVSTPPQHCSLQNADHSKENVAENWTGMETHGVRLECQMLKGISLRLTSIPYSEHLDPFHVCSVVAFVATSKHSSRFPFGLIMCLTSNWPRSLLLPLRSPHPCFHLNRHGWLKFLSSAL